MRVCLDAQSSEVGANLNTRLIIKLSTNLSEQTYIYMLNVHILYIWKFSCSYFIITVGITHEIFL